MVGYKVANDKYANGTHEKGYRWQCIDVVGDIPCYVRRRQLFSM